MSEKSRITKTQLLLILAGVVVIVLILLAPTHESHLRDKMSESAHAMDEHEHEHDNDHDADTLAAAEANALDKVEVDSVLANKFEILENNAESASNDADITIWYDTLVNLSIANRLPSYAAKYAKRKAMAVPTERNWMASGDIYFKSFQLSKKKNESMLKGAIAAYEKVLEIDPKNLDAKTSLGVAYVEGASVLGEMPMKGIGLLQEVLNSDPKNVNALTNMGYFAIQSGQYDKAIERFRTVLEIEPKNAEAYIYLSDVYLSMGEKEKGIETLEKFKELQNNPLVDQQVDDYIKKIRSN